MPPEVRSATLLRACGATDDDNLLAMFTIHATKKLLDRVKQPVRPPVADPAPQLGNWYATAIFRRPKQIALLVSEHTLLPVFVPLAPAASLTRRFPEHLARVLEVLGVRHEGVAEEIALMIDGSYAKTASRSLLGSLNDFVRLADYYRADDDADLLALSVHLARTPCEPLFKRHTSPDREVLAVFGQLDSGASGHP